MRLRAWQRSASERARQSERARAHLQAVLDMNVRQQIEDVGRIRELQAKVDRLSRAELDYENVAHLTQLANAAYDALLAVKSALDMFREAGGQFPGDGEHGAPASPAAFVKWLSENRDQGAEDSSRTMRKSGRSGRL